MKIINNQTILRMIHDFTLKELITHSYEEIEDKGRRLGILPDPSKCVPNQVVIRNILSYSKVLEVVKTKTAGNFNLIIN